MQKSRDYYKPGLSEGKLLVILAALALLGWGGLMVAANWAAACGGC